MCLAFFDNKIEKQKKISVILSVDLITYHSIMELG